MKPVIDSNLLSNPTSKARRVESKTAGLGGHAAVSFPPLRVYVSGWACVGGGGEARNGEGREEWEMKGGDAPDRHSACSVDDVYLEVQDEALADEA